MATQLGFFLSYYPIYLPTYQPTNQPSTCIYLLSSHLLSFLPTYQPNYTHDLLTLVVYVPIVTHVTRLGKLSFAYG
jgi:hypothetical protein